MRERDIEAWLRTRIEGMGGMFYKFTSPGEDGVPDRIAIFPDGRIVFVELKTKYGKLSRIQEYQIGRFLERHQQVCVVYGEEGASKFLRDMKNHVVSSVAYSAEGEYDLQST